jgi:uncharacterized membrane protein YphA (DoxX/SURF4 family)
MKQGGRSVDYSVIFLRLALGSSFLSAVADRFGLWGRAGEVHVAWGDFSHFVVYTERLTSILPVALGPAMAWIATIAETVLGLGLLLGIFTRYTAFLSGALLLLFAIAMTFALGVKAPLDFSVFSASAGAFLLSSCDSDKFSVDGLRRRRESDRSPLHRDHIA